MIFYIDWTKLSLINIDREVIKMQVTNIHEAKTHLSQYVELAFAGEEVVICKAGKPMAKLIRYQENTAPRTPGCWEGQVVIAEDFDELPESLLKAFRGEDHT